MDFKSVFEPVRYVKQVPRVSVDVSSGAEQRWRAVLQQCEEQGLSVRVSE
jgi:hypothetical protein